MSDDTPDGPTQPPKPDATARYSEAELSRIAREAVHQAPDARLDKELARLGLVDDADAAEMSPAQPTAAPAAGPAAADLEFERLSEEYQRLRDELGRTILLVRLLIAILVVLAIVVIVLLIR